jgi:peptidoglycan/LPS O-acetylase OafA/YrhL
MRVHFKNLDGIRFIASLLVVLHHMQYFKTESGVASWPVLTYMLKDAGRVGVNLFFVLSGFLISYLLMKENSEKGTINFKHFYIRRVLRIWPLYLAYGIVLIVLSPFVMQKLGILNQSGTHAILTNLLFMILFAVNIQLAFFPYNKGILEITWSVCIEEQFYLIWPLLLIIFKKRLKLLFTIMLSVGFLSKTLCLVLPHFFPTLSTGELFRKSYVLLFDKMELFGMGMFAAYLLFNQQLYKRLFDAILKPGIQWFMLIFTMLVMLSIIKIPVLSKIYYDQFIHAILFGYLMLLAVAPNSILHLETPLLRTLGKISYGVYLFHAPICQMLLIFFIKFFGAVKNIPVYEFVYPLTAIITTCIIAYLSYELYEKHFLKLKNRYTTIQTNDTKKRLPLEIAS